MPHAIYTIVFKVVAQNLVKQMPPTELRLDTKLIRAQLGEETKVMYVYRAHQQTMQPDVVVRTPFNLHDQLPN